MDRDTECSNGTSLTACCKSHICYLARSRKIHLFNRYTWCLNVWLRVKQMKISGKMNLLLLSLLSDESSGPLAVIIIPSLLALSTVLVVALIFCSFYKNKQRAQMTSAHFTDGMTSSASVRIISRAHLASKPASPPCCLFNRSAERISDYTLFRHSEGPGSFAFLGNPWRLHSRGAGVLADWSVWPHL